MKKTLSVVIVSFNSRSYLDRCLLSLNKSRVKSKTEIIVVDNASQDYTAEYISKKYKNISFVANNENIGFSKANNQGIGISHGKYVLLLNPDTIVPENTLSYMVEFMESNPGVGISTCMVELANGEIDDACHRGIPTPWNAFCHFLGLSKLFPGSLLLNGYHLGYRNLDKIHEIDACTGAFMLIRKKTGNELNWLDEDYYWYGEDIDFCYRVKKAGNSIKFVPGVKIIHYKGISSGIKKHSEKLSSATYKTKIIATKARFGVMKIFYRKHYQDGRSRLLIPLIFAGIKFKELITLFNLKLKEKYADRI